MKNYHRNMFLNCVMIGIFFIISFIAFFKMHGNLKSIWFFVFIICLFICAVGILIAQINKCHNDNINRIKDINGMLRTLNYSENEIEERQKYLTSLSESKSQEIQLKLKDEISKINEENFFEPLNK